MPARLGKLRKALDAFGVEVSEPGSGSHWKAQANGKTYTIPAHNGPKTELSDVYINGVCRAFDIDPKELKKLL